MKLIDYINNSTITVPGYCVLVSDMKVYRILWYTCMTEHACIFYNIIYVCVPGYTSIPVLIYL